MLNSNNPYDMMSKNSKVGTRVQSSLFSSPNKFEDRIKAMESRYKELSRSPSAKKDENIYTVSENL